MKLSLAVPSFEDSPSIADLEEELLKISSWGYDAVEPMICRPDAIEVDNIITVLDNCNIKVSGFRTGLIYLRDGLSLSDPDLSVRKQAVKRLSECLDLAVHFPGSTLLNGLVQGSINSGVTLEQAKVWIEESLRECCGHAEKAGVIFCLEPVNRYELGYHNTVEDVSGIVDRVGSSHLKILVDTFHMNIEEVDIYDSIRKYGRYIGAVHLADSNRSAPGDGHLNFSEIIAVLKEIEYSGYLTIEMGSQKDFKGAARKAFFYISNIL